MWDYLCVLKAIRPHISYFPAWKPNFESGFQPFMRILGGMPIPEGDIHAMMSFKRAMDRVVSEGKWLHVFPEGSMWYFYPDIRPLKLAAFQYAVKYDKPLIPISMSFRPRRGINKLFGGFKWFHSMFKPMLDKLVSELSSQGVECTPYEDRDWS